MEIEMLNTINIVKITEGVVDLWSFPADEKEQAEKFFLEKCEKLDPSWRKKYSEFSDDAIEDLLADGYLKIMNASVCLVHAFVEEK